MESILGGSGQKDLRSVLLTSLDHILGSILLNTKLRNKSPWPRLSNPSGVLRFQLQAFKQ